MLLFASLVSACGLDSGRRELFHFAGDTFSLAKHVQLTTPPPPDNDAAATPRAKFDALTAAWRDELEAAHVPGGAFAAVLDGAYAFGAGVGVTKAAETTPVTSRTLFRAASISKPLLAAAVLRAVEDGLLDLDRPVASYLEYLEHTEIGAVTLEQALSHTAGVAEDWQSTCALAASANFHDYLTSPPRDRLLFPAGRLFDYSNANYAVAAAVLAQVTQQPFDAFVAARVFAPAHMRTATYDPEAAESTEHASGQFPGTDPPDHLCPPALAAGGVWASVEDLAAFAQALLDSEHGLLAPGSLQTMFSAHAQVVRGRISYGLGMMLRSYKGLVVVSHGGDTPGFHGFIALVPERRFAAVALIDGEGDPSRVVRRAVDVFLDLETIPEDPVPPPRPLQDYVGDYRDERGRLGTVRVTSEEGKLWFEPLSGQPGPLDAKLEATFEFDAGADRAEFLVTRYGVARRIAVP